MALLIYSESIEAHSAEPNLRRSFYREYSEVIQKGMPLLFASTFYMYPLLICVESGEDGLRGIAHVVDLFAVAPCTVLTSAFLLERAEK